jgi:hypothetical protein
MTLPAEKKNGVDRMQEAPWRIKTWSEVAYQNVE